MKLVLLVNHISEAGFMNEVGLVGKTYFWGWFGWYWHRVALLRLVWLWDFCTAIVSRFCLRRCRRGARVSSWCRWCHSRVILRVHASIQRCHSRVIRRVHRCHSRVILNSRVILGCLVIRLPLMSESYNWTRVHRMARCDLYLVGLRQNCVLWHIVRNIWYTWGTGAVWYFREIFCRKWQYRLGLA